MNASTTAAQGVTSSPQGIPVVPTARDLPPPIRLPKNKEPDVYRELRQWMVNSKYIMSDEDRVVYTRCESAKTGRTMNGVVGGGFLGGLADTLASKAMKPVVPYQRYATIASFALAGGAFAYTRSDPCVHALQTLDTPLGRQFREIVNANAEGGASRRMTTGYGDEGFSAPAPTPAPVPTTSRPTTIQQQRQQANKTENLSDSYSGMKDIQGDNTFKDYVEEITDTAKEEIKEDVVKPVRRATRRFQQRQQQQQQQQDDSQYSRGGSAGSSGSYSGGGGAGGGLDVSDGRFRSGSNDPQAPRGTNKYGDEMY